MGLPPSAFWGSGPGDGHPGLCSQLPAGRSLSARAAREDISTIKPRESTEELGCHYLLNNGPDPQPGRPRKACREAGLLATRWL